MEGTPSPFLHDRGDHLYNPLTGASLPKDGEAYRALVRLGTEAATPGVDAAILEHLRTARFLIDDVERESRMTHLLYLSLETCTVCNHRCPFCPVSLDPREKEVMSQELFESVVDQTAAVAGKDLVIFLSNYNEPTMDPLFEDRVRYLFGRGLSVSILTNASGFTPARSRLFEGWGRFRYIGINMPTLRADRYQKLHGTRDLARVLENIDSMNPNAMAVESAIVVLGDDDEEHHRDAEEIRQRFQSRGWVVKPFKVRARPATGIYVPEPPPKKRLKGCELMSSRPFEHLHVTATGRAVLCCQDYWEKLQIGDVKRQTVAEILGGDVIARLRRWVYGVEEAPEDFLCRRCESALGE